MIFGITMGDSSGVGPEILLKAARNGEIPHPFVVYGDLAVLERANRQLGYGLSIAPVTSPSMLAADRVNVIDHALLREDDVRPGELSRPSGKAARDYVVSAANACLRGEIAAMVTLPMNKEATQLSDPKFTGHTELIGEVCNAPDVTIMLASNDLVVTHVSTHVSLREAIERAKKPRVLRIIEMTCEAVARLHSKPRIAVAGLNPHAGENGLFGQEEIEEIRPAVEEAQAKGLPVDGPFPPDTVFYMAVRRKKFDAIVCMYHDQGHIPSKLLDFEAGVNVTLGLPIIRTSVDHGTAFDIAWKGIASTTSLVSAFNFAVRMASGPR
ncbi:MAG: 4-hydroxythreonine-4-phosphate dehydrogenase PdxA [Bryobacterales bacterium]|nr:4-hydroxythreonine-4-phosphate dehydrogenase PdxA [Bryobacterales bacterium]